MKQDIAIDRFVALTLEEKRIIAGALGLAMLLLSSESLTEAGLNLTDAEENAGFKAGMQALLFSARGRTPLVSNNLSNYAKRAADVIADMGQEIIKPMLTQAIGELDE